MRTGIESSLQGDRGWNQKSIKRKNIFTGGIKWIIGVEKSSWQRNQAKAKSFAYHDKFNTIGNIHQQMEA